MILAVCIDDANGLMFNNRRVSSDSAVVRDLLDIAGACKITAMPYSLPLFQGVEERISVAENLNPDAAFFFAESGDFLEIKESVDQLIIYKWNRRYPSDRKFPVDAYKKRMTLKSTTEFEGTSHPCITREVYVR